MFARLSAGSCPGGRRAWYWNTSVDGSGHRASRPSGCCHMCHTSRSRPSTSRSATIMRISSRVSPTNATPACTRTRLCPPSQPTSHCAVTVSASPPLASTADTVASDCSKRSSAVPNSTTPPRSASRSRSASSVRHWGVIRLVVYGMSGRFFSASGSAPPSVTRPSRPVDRIGMAIRPCAITRSPMPRSSNTSSVRGWRPLPRDPRCGPPAASIRRNGTPRRASSQASIRPVGPAPAISTAGAVRCRRESL